MSWDSKAKKIVEQEYAGAGNPLTPTPSGFGIIRDHLAYELATNEERSQWGVSFVEFREDRRGNLLTRRRHALSRAFPTPEQAKGHIEAVRTMSGYRTVFEPSEIAEFLRR